MNGPNKYHPLLGNESPWKNNPNTIWLGSTVILNRNLEKFNFPGKLANDKKKQIISLLSQDLLVGPTLKNPKLIKAEDMQPNEKEFLVEHFLSPLNFQQAHSGEAFILDETGEFLGLLNVNDHLSLQLIDCKEEPEITWDRLAKIEMRLNKNINFAFSPRYGFLTSDASGCGTAFVLYVYLHLPALIHSKLLQGVINRHKDDGIEQTGLQGDPEEIIGDVVVFHNSYTLGVTEENILSSLHAFSTKLQGEEKSLRAQIRQEESPEMKNRVSRAFAILLHSYQIEAVEALNAISLLKFGADVGWVTGVDQSLLNELFFNCRRAHLLCHYGAKLTHEEIPHKRAEFIHHALKGIQLHIDEES